MEPRIRIVLGYLWWAGSRSTVQRSLVYMYFVGHALTCLRNDLALPSYLRQFLVLDSGFQSSHSSVSATRPLFPVDRRCARCAHAFLVAIVAPILSYPRWDHCFILLVRQILFEFEKSARFFILIVIAIPFVHWQSSPRPFVHALRRRRRR